MLWRVHAASMAATVSASSSPREVDADDLGAEARVERPELDLHDTTLEDSGAGRQRRPAARYARPRASAIRRPSTRLPSARRPLCSYSFVIQGRRPRIRRAVSIANSRST